MRLASQRAPRVADRVVIMCREPSPGSTKTRLNPRLGAHGAAQLAAQLLRRTIETIDRSSHQRPFDIELCVTGAWENGMLRHMARHRTCTDQGDGDLGARMQRVLVRAWDRGFTKTVIVGSDCPTLSEGDLHDTLDALNDSDVVLGPASDGGYYLVGVRNGVVPFFEGTPWSTSNVFRYTSNRLRSLNTSLHTLTTRDDIDVGEDLPNLLGTPHDATPELSIVIPTLNEQDHIAAALASTASNERVERIVVDAKSTDRTPEIAASMGARVLLCEPSRGLQLNTGAEAARSNTLLFLHADSRLPHGYVQHVMNTLAIPNTSTGAFRFALDAPGRGLRVIESGANIRSRLLKRPYGDQALFMHKETFQSAGGFPLTGAMEDFKLLRQLRPFGRIRIANAAVITSARKWIEHGALRTTFRHQCALWKHYLGI